MYDFLKKVKTNSLVSAALCALLGVVLLVWPGLSTSVLCTALGVVVLICGAVDILIFLANRNGTLYATFHLVLGVILAAVGVWLIVRPTLVAVLIPRIIGILICIHGAADVGDALTLRRHDDAHWTAALILGLLSLLLGALLVWNPFTAFTTVVRIIGAVLLYDGVTDFWITLQVSRAVKNAVLPESGSGWTADSPGEG